MRKMILGIMAFICALPAFAMDGGEHEYGGQSPQQQLLLKVGVNGENEEAHHKIDATPDTIIGVDPSKSSSPNASPKGSPMVLTMDGRGKDSDPQQESWWILPKSVKGALELPYSYLRKPEGKEDTKENEGKMTVREHESLGEEKKDKTFFVKGQVTLEKIPEEGPEKGKIYVEKIEQDQLKCTGFMTLGENGIENTFPISAPIPLFVADALTPDYLNGVQFTNPNQIQDLFEYTLKQLKTEGKLEEHIYREKSASGTLSIQEPTRAGWWSTGASLLTPSSWLSYSNSDVDPTEIEHEEEQGKSSLPSSSMEGTPTQRSWGLGSFSDFLARSSEGEKESQKSEDSSEKRDPTMSSFPNFPTPPMPANGIPFATSASSTDPLVTPEPPKGMWGSVEGYLEYLNLGGYLGEKEKVVTIALQAYDQEDKSMDVTEENLKEWKVIGQEKKKEKYKTFLMSKLPESGVPGEREIYVKDFHNKLQVKLRTLVSQCTRFLKMGRRLRRGRDTWGQKILLINRSFCRFLPTDKWLPQYSISIYTFNP